MIVNNKDQFKQRLLMAMYLSVDRMNKHWCEDNSLGIISEKYYQQNLRKDFTNVGCKRSPR